MVRGEPRTVGTIPLLGGRHEGYVTSSQSRMKVPGRAVKGAIVVQTFGMTFSKLPDVAGDWSLLYVFPARRETREYPFTIVGVPLP